MNFGQPLTICDLEKLEREGIPRDLANLAIRRVDSHEGGAVVGRNGSGDYSGLVFSNVWPGDSHERQHRLRLDNPELEADGNGIVKPKFRYLTAPGSRNLCYFAPGTKPAWLNDASLPILLTEGEKKTLALFALAWHGLDASEIPRFLPVGLSGVFNFKGITGIGTGPEGQRCPIKGVIPDFDRINWRERSVTIVFDVDGSR